MLFGSRPPHIVAQEQRQNFKTTYPFLSGRILNNDQKNLLINFVPLRERLETYTAEQDFKVGLFFEYLPSGVSIGVNDSEVFVSASLLKVPLVMQVYKSIENGTIKKTDILEIRQQNIDKRFGDLWKRGIGAEITVEEAVQYSLIKSDNTAKSLLFGAIPDGNIDPVFDSLDIPKEVESSHAVISAFHYSSILRSLYLSSYLSPASSQEILSLMTQSKYRDKLPAGVPEGVKVAHKIGVYEEDNDIDPSTPENESIYSDCGIVYVPNRPYMLCIFAQTTEDRAREYMKTVAKMTYTYVSGSEGM